MSKLDNFGLMLEPQLGMKTSEVVEWAKLAEECRFGYLFRSDHLLPTGTREKLDAPECWTSLAALAALTSRIRFGPLVTPLGFRNPALLAKMACTLHSFSNQRLVLGIGLGWNKEEYFAHGMGFPNNATRLEQFVEGLEIVKPLIQGRRADFEGAHFSAHTECFPKPKSKIHLIVGGKSERMAKIAAKYADEWNTYDTPLEEFMRFKTVVDRNSGTRKVECTLMCQFLLAENLSELRERAKRSAKYLRIDAGVDTFMSMIQKHAVKNNEFVFGLVDDFVSQLNRLFEGGVDKLYLHSCDPMDFDMVRLLRDTISNKL